MNGFGVALLFVFAAATLLIVGCIIGAVRRWR